MLPAMDRQPLPEHVGVLVIGAGFGGLGLAVKLAERGERDFVVVERGGEVGGTWRDNTYPGAACDVPSQLYSFSWAPNPDWSRSFSEQPEIQDYLRRVARDTGVLPHFRFHVDFLDAHWDEDATLWRISTSAGDCTANVLVSAAGALSEPKMPDIEGIDSFAGQVFHSARWDHDADLTGKRVAIIGTGASAVQIAPEIADRVGRLDVYQRTAPWVLPRTDRAYSGVEKWVFRHVPGAQRLVRAAIYLARESYVPAFTRNPRLAAPAKQLALANIKKGVRDPALREKVVPDFEIGCKRILISSDWYPTLSRDDVELVTDRIAKVTPSAVVTADGVERETDVLIVATGFHATEQPVAEQITGRHGQSLSEAWAGTGVQAYKGATVHGFPNLFFLIGPNTGLGHTSMVYMIESQVAYVLDALETMRTRGLDVVEPTVQAQRAWNDDLQRRMRRTVWNTGGCSSWYLDAHGRNVTLWPRTTYTFRRLTARFDPQAYRTTTAGRRTTAKAHSA
jgi:cation diffusion facilitator CzcD-associated flavoprotein CzcO